MNEAKTDYETLVDEIEQTLDRVEPRLGLEEHRAAVAELRRQAENYRKIRQDIAEIRAEIIDPVNAELRAGRRFSTLGFAVGIGAIVVTVALFALSNPIATSSRVDETVTRLDNVDSDLSEMTAVIGQLSQNSENLERRFQRLEAMTRTALTERATTLTGTGLEPVEGEIRLQRYQRPVVLNTEGGGLALRYIDVRADTIDGVRTLLAEIDVSLDGRLLSGDGLNEVVSIDGPLADRRANSGTRFMVVPGDTITFYGLYKYEVLRILSEEAHERPIADAESAVYIVNLPD